MNPKYFQPQSGHRDRWMISYMDVLTILLIFFVALAAQGLQRRLPDSGVAPVTKPIARIDPAAESRQRLVRAQQKLERHGLEMRLETGGLVISLPQAILFPSGEDRVSPQALPIVARIADVLRDIPNEARLVGHADAVPIHNRHFKDNWDLASARGLKLLELLSCKYGIRESRLSVASYGTYRPNRPNDTPAGRAHNRRVEIVILPEAAPGAR